MSDIIIPDDGKQTMEVFINWRNRGSSRK